jgi:hypothetical protein
MGPDILSPEKFIMMTGTETVHEYGHRTRRSLAGIDPGFNPDYLPFTDSPYSFSLGLVSHNNDTGLDVWKGRKSRILYDTPSFLKEGEGFRMVLIDGELVIRHALPEIDIISNAAGMNQQVNLALDLAYRNSINDHLDIATFFSYYHNSNAYFVYNDEIFPYVFGDGIDAGNEQGDRAALLASWQQRGQNYNDAKLARDQIAVFFISGTTWSYILGSLDYIATGNRLAPILRYNGFRIPDFYNYYNLKGPTLKAISDYRVNQNQLISFAFEAVSNGKKSQEVSLGFNHGMGSSQQFLVFEIDSLYNLHSKKGAGNILVGLNFENNYSASIGISSYHFETLSGERDIPSLKDGKSYREIYARIIVNF